MSMNPQVLQRYQQLVAQGVPAMQAYATAQHEAESGMSPSMLGIPGMSSPAAALGVGSDTAGAPPPSGVAPLPRPQSPPPSSGGQPTNTGSGAQTNGTPPSPGGGSRGGGNDKTASDYAPSLSSAKPSPDTSHAADPTNGPNQPAAPDAPAQASDPNQAGPQSGNSAYPGTTPAEQANQFYGLGQQDTPETYAARIFKGAGALGSEKGFNGLDFSDERLTGSPWGQFLQSRYLPEVQSDLTLGHLANPGDATSDFNQNLARTVLANVAQGNGAPAGGGMAALKSMAADLSNFDPKNTTGMSQSKASGLESLYNDPKAQAQTILGQMQGVTGGWGMNFLRNELANQAQLSYDNPTQYPLNSFASRVMPMIGMGS